MQYGGIYPELENSASLNHCSGAPMQLINDTQAGMSYLKLVPDADVHRTEVLEEESVVIDYDRDGRVIGIELFGTVEVVDR